MTSKTDKRERAIQAHIDRVEAEIRQAGWQNVEADVSTATVEAWSSDSAIILTYEVDHDSAMDAHEDGWVPVVDTVLRDHEGNEIWLEGYDRLPSQVASAFFMAAIRGEAPKVALGDDRPPRIDTTTSETWASTWVDQMEWYAQHGLPPAYRYVDELLIDKGADLPWTPDHAKDVLEAIAQLERWPAVVERFKEAHGHDLSEMVSTMLEEIG